MKTKLAIMFLLCLSVVAFRSVESSVFEVPDHFPKPVYDFSHNALTDSKIQLGRALFYDPLLSRDNTISCASCHSQFSAFTHVDHALSHGIDDKIGFRNSAALMNLAWQKTFMRDGAIHHLDVQALAPISSAVEMDENIAHVVSKLQATKLYSRLFAKAFGDSVITGEHTLKALSQFMLTLISANSKYDSVMRKQTEFSVQEGRGYRLFQASCASCHAEPLFSNDDFSNNGLTVDSSLRDYGRYRVTGKASDSLLFKVPTLRNIEYSYPYMHDGRFKTLSQVMNHYTSGIVQSPTLAAALRAPLVLGSNEKVDLIAFLLTLSDKSFVFNPRYFYPKAIFADTAKD